MAYMRSRVETIHELKDALQLIWSALTQKSIDKAVKDFRKRLRACVSANGGHFELNYDITVTGSYILLMISYDVICLFDYKIVNSQYSNLNR